MINNSAIQMVLRGPNAPQNVEDTYETVPTHNSNYHMENLGVEDDGTEVAIPSTCDVKEALVVKLEEIDNKIFHLLNSNQYLKDEIKEDPDAAEEYE